MNWLNALIYFNDETNFIIWSKLYINICIYKFLWKIVQKIYLIYIYILTGTCDKHSITNSCQNEWICSYMNNQYQFLLSAAWHNQLVLCIHSHQCATGFEITERHGDF